MTSVFEYRPARTASLTDTVLHHRRGPADPSLRVDGATIWRASYTPEGAATLAMRQRSDGVIEVQAWGAGAAWASAQLPALCGALDDDAGFDPSTHPLLDATARRRRGLRLTRSDLPFDALTRAVLDQKVTSLQAYRAWSHLLRRRGHRAPGPRTDLVAPPSREEWRAIPSWEWHRAGVEPPQSRTITAIAQRGEPKVDRLLGYPGIGQWTEAETRILAVGDPDAVSVGDYHLAHDVGFALTGHRVDDDGMIELLEPWRGHRQRVIRLIMMSGAREPRRGPRLAPEDHRSR